MDLKLEDLKTALVVLFFVVPGFVFFQVYSWFGWRPRNDEKNIQLLLLQYFSVSCLFLLGFFLFQFDAISIAKDKQLVMEVSNLAFLYPALAAVLLGLLVRFGGWLSEKASWLSWVPAVLNRLGWFRIEPIPTGWDWKFYQLEDGVYLIVTLNDGSQVAGYFGAQSLASDDSKERDIYIEKVYEIGRNGRWRLRERTDGILLKASEIRFIEFFKPN